jgi:hypothetical protein
MFKCLIESAKILYAQYIYHIDYISLFQLTHALYTYRKKI